MIRLVALALSGLLLTASARAQVPSIDDVEATVVEELVVQGRLSGPAWWKVLDVDTTVYVLGARERLPSGVAWDQSVLARRLVGADRLITPPAVALRAGLRDLRALYGVYRRASHGDRPLEGAIPP